MARTRWLGGGLDGGGAMTRGGRNLIIMGVAAVAVAMLTTGVSLAIYHNSGDIYLDRSRPGFLPDEEEISDGGPEVEYQFDESGAITAEDLGEYLEEFQKEIEAVDAYADPFAAEALSDERLGI